MSCDIFTVSNARTITSTDVEGGFVLLSFVDVASGITLSQIDASKEIDNMRLTSLSALAKALPKVELHIHLDGAMRPSTLWELAKKKGIPPLPDWVRTEQDFASLLVMRDDGNLPEFLKKFNLMLPQVAGDKGAIKRVAYELCQDKSKEGVVYFEARYAPQFLMSPSADGSVDCRGTKVGFNDVVQAVNQGLEAGSKDFGLMAKSILCVMRGKEHSKWAGQVVKSAIKFRNSGVVGVDLAGDESLPEGGVDEEIVKAFDDAHAHGIPITIHAGESGPAANVEEAVKKLHARRIGHGYHVLDNRRIYNECVKKIGTHLEQCPFSSVKTGAFDLKKNGWPHHPLATFFNDQVSFSINTDDPTVTGHSLVAEFENVTSSSGMSLPAKCLVTAVRNATEAAFVDGDEKIKLREIIEEKTEDAYDDS